MGAADATFNTKYTACAANTDKFVSGRDSRDRGSRNNSRHSSLNQNDSSVAGKKLANTALARRNRDVMNAGNNVYKKQLRDVSSENRNRAAAYRPRSRGANQSHTSSQ